MSYKDPKGIMVAATRTGSTKAALAPGKALVAGFLAGAYIAFAGLLAITVSAGLKPETWGTLPTLFTGAVFSLGLILVVIAGSELLTGNMALVPIAMLRRKVGFGALGLNFTIVRIGTLIGSLFVAYFLPVKAGVTGMTGGAPPSPAGMTFERLKAIAVLKGDTEGADQIFLRALGCNWLVCLAVWVAMTAEDTGGKILGIFFPIMAFVAMGFDHVVANMFFLPAAIFAHVPDIGWGDALKNWVFAFRGNLVGAAIFVSTTYWYLYLREPAGTAVGGGGEGEEGDGHRQPRAALATPVGPTCRSLWGSHTSRLRVRTPDSAPSRAECRAVSGKAEARRRAGGPSRCDNAASAPGWWRAAGERSVDPG